MNMIFNASAGTGKTWQVTKLYSALVLGTDHPDLPAAREPVLPERILLMTFTDNAAVELRERVSASMIDVEGGDDYELSEAARAVLRKLPAANISTIHAFCAGLVRENALELGLSPRFSTLEDEERTDLLDEVLKKEIFEMLENDVAFRDFCSGISVLGDHEYSVLATVRGLLETASSRGLDLSAAQSMLPPPDQSISKADFIMIHQQLADIHAERGLPKKASDVFELLNRFIQEYPAVGTLAKIGKFTGKGMKPISDHLAGLKEQYLTEVNYAENIDLFRAFASCLGRCAEAFAEAKRSRDVVDFGDQLVFARDVLKSHPVEEAPFDWIIVDEVQDTSRVQCNVIESLWTDETNLVICGDKKQSIYAWRSADPEVMPDLEKSMQTRPDFRSLPLKESYRSKDRVLNAVNALFMSIYDDYAQAALEAVEQIGAITTDEVPCVEFLIPDSEEDGTEEEMTAVAQRIRLLVNGDEVWRPVYGHDGSNFVKGTPVRYGDILILLKRSTHQPVLERALREAGVPYTSGGKGSGLFEQQEVRDLFLFLQTVAQPTNDLALVGYMRSPFAGMSDAEIVKAGWDGETFDHEILRKQFLEGESEAATRLLRFRSLVGTQRPSQLVRALVQETAFDAFWAGQPDGEQKLSNFKKALDWLRTVERGGHVLLGDVVRRFERAIKNPPRSGAAEALLPDPEQNAVTLMTVHGAKGLTKRICFVPDISFGDTSDSGFATLSADETLEMNITGVAGEKTKSPGWTATRDADKAVRAIESKNVFYVAMTRARDLVVLSGAGTSRKSGWLKLADEFLDTASADLICRRTFAEIPILPAVDLAKHADEEVPAWEAFSVTPSWERKPVTSLCKKSEAASDHEGETRLNPARYGTVGHDVLEQLALNNWEGDIAALIEEACALAGPIEVELLQPQLERVRDRLSAETASAIQMMAEFPFVLRRNKVILDGTIDLLVELPDRWVIFDYKFSSEAPEALMQTYRPQLMAYREAVVALNPGVFVDAVLVQIADEVQFHPMG